MQQVTRQDVARLAGTSPAVVSYVLNNGPRPVAPSTRIRVQDAIETLGYRPNQLARALRSQRSNTIGLVVPDSSEAFFTELVHAVEQAAFAAGSLVLLGNSRFDRRQELRYLESLASMQVSGILLVRSESGESETEGRDLADLGVPAVYLNHRAPRDSGATSVLLANHRGGSTLTEHLIAHGHRRIGCLTGTAPSGPVFDRAEGWAAAMRAAALDPSFVLRTGLDRHSTREQVKAWLQGPEPPDAIVATADGLALDALSAAQEIGLRVPGDLAVVGFGGTGPSAHSWPPLTTIGHPFADFGRLALETLTSVQKQAQSVPDHVLDVDLIVRRSCGC
ncbi:LacI family transcriptional regulator [Murinocardiopsis flavida]|uniref:LacI family transcriptional regulator n=1 Tax=Murinocardiopsis flavida TaxID=645275 RepID=A0A2P8DKU3_9ACTN|nr:LacI family DNA-binding transcriptional regulator [Murinocardiopsis flavida]PSK97840.1 LacI family transcriptional regulator [Murinocardiopsis flavida]